MLNTDRDLVTVLEEVVHTPLGALPLSLAQEIIRDVFDRQGEESPVPVARFGSAI